MKKENLVEKLLGIIFLLCGLIVLLIGLICAFFSANVQRTYKKVTGEIVNRERIYDSDIPFELESMYGSTWVVYESDGKYYLAGLKEENSSWYYGKQVTLYVDREDPLHVRSESLLYLPTWILSVVELPFTVIGAVFLIIVSKRKKKKKRLMETGERIWAEVTGGHINYYYTLGTRHPYRFECSYTDPYSGQIRICESGNIFLNPAPYIGRQIAIFVDRENPKRYYVDVESLDAGERQ